MEIERKYLIEKNSFQKISLIIRFTESSRDISVLPRSYVSADRMMNIFSHTNQKASWPEKNIIFH